MLFYVKEKSIKSIDNISRDLFIAQSDDLIATSLSIENGKYIWANKEVLIPIYIFPVFNLNNLNRQLLFIYSYQNKSYRFIRNVDKEYYGGISMLATFHDNITQPLLKFSFMQSTYRAELYRGINNNMIRIVSFDNNSYKYLLDCSTLKHMYNFHKLYSIDLYRSLHLSQVTNDDKTFYSISIFGSIYYLYSLVKNIFPDMITNYKQNWVVSNDYFNNILNYMSSYSVEIPFLQFTSKKSAKLFLDKLKAKLAFILCFH